MSTETPSDRKDDFTDQTALVTGGGRGIGQGICLELADRGADIVVADLDADEIAETESMVTERGQEALAVQTDVTDEANVESTVEQALDRFGSIEILVNNAGIAGPTAPVEEVGLEEWDQTLDVNLRGPYLMCREVVPAMKAAEYGRIVNISSIAGKRPLLHRTPYAASKMGLIGFTRTLAIEVGDHDINVNAVCPGPVMGPRIDRVYEKQAEARDISYEEVKAEDEAETARGEIMDRSDIARMVATLCSADTTKVTGQDINVSAGMVMY
ncbi:MAG: SDR family oxidoreductase [Halobacteriales archaeon]|nr:SDR family oxidoreductase [Halobacteriales archaeon]